MTSETEAQPQTFNLGSMELHLREEADAESRAKVESLDRRAPTVLGQHPGAVYWQGGGNTSFVLPKISPGLCQTTCLK